MKPEWTIPNATPPFTVDVFGAFQPGQIRLRWHETASVVDPQVERLKADWPRHVEEVTRVGGVLFNGQMVRYLAHQLCSGTLVIDTEPTDYATFYCTNYLNHALGDRIGWQHFANPIGISANVMTADGWLLYGRRGSRVACHPNTVHTFGGTLEPTDRNDRGELDVFLSVARELREELHLPPTEPIDLVCLGMIRDAEMQQPELVFDARLTRTRQELESSLTPDDAEHASIVALRDDSQACTGFPRDIPHAVPVALGSLALHVRTCCGDSTYASLLTAISRG